MFWLRHAWSSRHAASRGRSADRHPPRQVVADAPVGHGQIPAGRGRGDGPKVERHGAPADSYDYLSIAKHSRQPGLHALGRVGQVGQKERAAPRRHQGAPAGHPLDTAPVGGFTMSRVDGAEDGQLQLVARPLGAVHPHERRVRAGAAIVDFPGEHGAPRSALAAHQRAGLARGGVLDRLERPAHGERPRDDRSALLDRRCVTVGTFFRLPPEQERQHARVQRPVKHSRNSHPLDLCLGRRARGGGHGQEERRRLRALDFGHDGGSAGIAEVGNHHSPMPGKRSQRRWGIVHPARRDTHRSEHGLGRQALGRRTAEVDEGIWQG
jgi:hypothetical protein